MIMWHGIDIICRMYAIFFCPFFYAYTLIVCTLTCVCIEELDDHGNVKARMISKLGLASSSSSLFTSWIYIFSLFPSPAKGDRYLACTKYSYM